MKLDDLKEQEVGWAHLLGTLAVAVCGGLVGLVVLGVVLGVTKVRNELAMTDAYVRQAVALESIAGSLEAMLPKEDSTSTTGVVYASSVAFSGGAIHFFENPKPRPSSGYWP